MSQAPMKESKFSSFRLSLDEKLVGNVEIVSNTQKETEQQVETPSGDGVNRRIADLRRLVLNRGKLQQRFSEQMDREQYKSQSQPPPRKVSYVQTHNLQRQHLIKEILSANKPIDLMDPQHSEIMLEVLKKAIRNKEEISLIQLFLTNSSVMQLDPNGTLSVSDLAAQIYPFVSYSFAPKDSTIYTAGQFALHCYTVIKGSVGQISEDDFKAMTLATSNKPKITEFQCSSPKNTSANKKNVKFGWGKQETEQLLPPEPNEVQYEKIFKEGQSFGDVEILTNQTRSTTTVSLEDTHLIMISKEGFELVLSKFRKQQVEENITFVKQFSFFQEIPVSRLLTLMDSGKTVKFSNKQIIYTEGDEIENIYFITSGEVSLSLVKEDRRINLQILGANSYFGSDETSDQSSVRSHRAQSNSNNLSTIMFPLQKLQKFLSYHKQLDRFIADAKMKARFRKGIAEKIIQTQNQFQSDSEQSFKKQAEYDREIRKHIEASRKLAPKLDEHQREEEMKDLRKFETVGKIVNAREEIFTMLDKQRQENNSSTNNLNRYAIKANHSKQRFVSQWEEPSYVQHSSTVAAAQGQNQQNKNSQHLIFDTQRDLLFGQSYYLSQTNQRSTQLTSNNMNSNNNTTDPQYQKDLESSRKSSGRSSIIAESPIKQSRRLTNKTTNSFSSIKQNISNNTLSSEVMGLVNPIREFFSKNDININNLGKKLGTRLEERLMGKDKQTNNNKNGKQENSLQLEENSIEKEDQREIKTSQIIESQIDRNEEVNKGRREILTASQQHRNLSRRHLLGIKQGDVWNRKDVILDNSNSLYMNNASLRNNNNNNNSSYNNINIQTYSANAISSASSKKQPNHFHLRRDTSIDILQDKSQQNLLINSFRIIEKEPGSQSVNPQNSHESPANRNRNYHSTSYGLVPFQSALAAEKSFNIGSPGSNTPMSTGSGSGGSNSLCQDDKKLNRKNSTFSKAIENNNKMNEKKTTSNLLSQYFPSSFQIQAKQEMDSFEKTEKSPEQLPLLNCNSYDLIHNEINRFPLSLQKKFKLNKIEKLQKERVLLSNSSSDHLLQQPNTKRATNQLS